MKYFCKSDMEWGIQCDKQCQDCNLSQSMSDNDDKLKDTFKEVIKEGINEYWPLRVLIMHAINKAEYEEEYEVAAKLTEAQQILKNNEQRN